MVSQAPPLSIPETRLHALGQFLQMLRETSTNDQRIQVTLNYLQQQVEPALIWIGLLNADTQSITYGGGAVQDFDPNQLPPSLPKAAGDLIDQVFVHQRPIGVSDLSTEARSSELINLALKFAILGCAVLPICDRNNCQGIVILGWQQPGLMLHPDQISCLNIALKELGSTLTLETIAPEFQGYKSSGTLPGLLDKLCQCDTLDMVIETIALEVHSQLRLPETRLFWLDPQRFTFNGRKSLIQGKPNPKGVGEDAQLSVRDMGKLYSDLRSGLAASLISGANAATMQILAQIINQPQKYSALLTPIRSAQTLLGFILVGYETLHPLQDNAKEFLKSAADALALAGAKFEAPRGRATPVDVLQSCMQALSTVEMGANGLKSLAMTLCQSLQAKHFSVLHLDVETQTFGVSLQMTAQKRQLLPARMSNLAPLDWELFTQNEPVICIDHWAEDLRLHNWRSAFAELGMQSALICPLEWAGTLEGLLVIGHDTPRVWLPDEMKLLVHLKDPLGWLVNQWRTRHYLDARQRLSQAILAGIDRVQQVQSLTELEQVGTQTLGEVFSTTLTALITWYPAASVGTLVSLYPSFKDYPVDLDQTLELAQVPLLTELRYHPDGILNFPRSSLPANWGDIFPDGKYDHVVAIAVQPSPHHLALGAFWIGVQQFKRDWDSERFLALQALVREIAWVRYRLLVTAHFTWRQQQLEQLNWHKIQTGGQQLERLSLQLNWLKEQEPTFGQGAEQTTTPTLLKRRYQDVLQSLTTLTRDLKTQTEVTAWQLPSSIETLLVPTFLKGVLERLEPISRKYQIWTQIHPLPEESTLALHQISIHGEITHYQMILDNVLGMACRRCVPQTRIDFWPRILEDNWLELSMTDTSELDSRLIEALAVGWQDPLSPSPLAVAPGLPLWICQHLIRSVGGDLGFYHLEDGRLLTRLVLPITCASS